MEKKHPCRPHLFPTPSWPATAVITSFILEYRHNGQILTDICRDTEEYRFFLLSLAAGYYQKALTVALVAGVVCPKVLNQEPEYIS